MASLLTNVDTSSFTGILADHFDTFKRDITIYKEPLKIVNVSTNNVMAGYGESSDSENISFVPVSGVFSALVNYQGHQDLPYIAEVSSLASKGVVKIKVEKDARDYIQDGKTERVVVDDSSFNIVSDDKLQNFLGIHYYVYFLEKTD
jgi:hypothetical protein